MATARAKLTLEQFQEQFARSERAYEFWYGEAIPKSSPTWVHGLLQALIAQLLKESGSNLTSNTTRDLATSEFIRPLYRPAPRRIVARLS